MSNGISVDVPRASNPDEEFVSLILNAIRRPEQKCSIDTATAFYESKTQKEKPKGKHWTLLAHCYYISEDYEKSYLAYKKALYTYKDDKNPFFWYGIGNLYLKFNSLKYAEPAFLAVIKIAPEFEEKAMVYFHLGLVYKNLNQFQNSEFYLRKSSELIFETKIKLKILTELGRVLEYQNKHLLAIRAYLQALDIERSEELIKTIGNMYVALGDYENANLYLKQLEEMNKEIAVPMTYGIIPSFLSQILISCMPMLNVVNQFQSFRNVDTEDKVEDSQAAEILSGIKIRQKRSSFDCSLGRKKRRIQ